MTQDLVLVMHGTQPSNLSPQAIVQTAEADLKRKKKNERIRAERKREKVEKGFIATDETIAPLAFLEADVKAATSVRELIASAIHSRNAFMAKVEMYFEACKMFARDEIDTKPRAPNATTVEIYKDLARLEAALKLASIQ